MMPSLLLSSLDLGTVTERDRVLTKVNKLLEELNKFNPPNKAINDVVILVIARLKKEIENDESISTERFRLSA